MSVERSIREKHALRDRLRAFLLIAAVMTDDEVELGLGRLADLLNAAENDREALDIRLRGAALKIYFDLRKAGEASQDSKGRKKYPERARHRQAQMIHERATKEWQEKDGTRQEEHRKLPFWKRVFLQPPPESPHPWIAYERASRYVERGLQEILLEDIASFRLVPEGMQSPDVTLADVKLLL